MLLWISFIILLRVSAMSASCHSLGPSWGQLCVQSAQCRCWSDLSFNTSSESRAYLQVFHSPDRRPELLWHGVQVRVNQDHPGLGDGWVLVLDSRGEKSSRQQDILIHDRLTFSVIPRCGRVLPIIGVSNLP